MSYKILGFGANECICQRCGKTDLRGTYAIENTEDGTIGRFGSTCAWKVLRIKPGQFAALISTIKEEQTAALRRAVTEDPNMINWQKRLEASGSFPAQRIAFIKANPDPRSIIEKKYRTLYPFAFQTKHTAQ